MATQRTIKKSICVSEDINSLSFFEEVLFYRLIVNANDQGEMDGRPEIIRATCFPLKRDMTLSAIRKAISNMSTVGLVTISEEGGRPTLKLTKWECHQRIRTTSAPSAEKNEGLTDYPAATCGEPRQPAAAKEKKKEKPPHSPVKEKRKENINDSLSKGAYAYTHEGFTAPTLDEVSAYISEQKLTVDAQLWHSFYSSNGWTVGGSPMRDWRGSLHSWHLRGARSDKPHKSSDGITEHTFDGDEFMKLAINRAVEQ